MQASLCQGFVLHRRPYRETSFLVDLLTEQWGKVRVMARGQRNRKNGGSHLLQPFRLLQMGLAGRGELKQLRTVEAAELAYPLQGRALFSALYLNELLTRLLQAELPVPELFSAYRQSLVTLVKQPDELEPILRNYELLLLNELGYAPDFQHHANGEILVDDYYRYDEDEGFTPVAAGSNARGLFRGQDLLAIGERHWHPDTLRAAKRLNRLALQPLLGSKPLKSRELFMTLEG
ncbi:DNA repair protein RecO [Saliniradius amylolyticus]|uniref:DNA repair protein RecO n=1 Tax=Saliniradius amylolyticus TaxID=2183582 RepID=A0A2S2E043_9ALTE|nr:DNA repair protein RecO [Saliniradius amylolyticus]AWL11014.1 DNA repair protein RecO [Saliniradius amylolyticus]